jgi:hypothetical protein
MHSKQRALNRWTPACCGVTHLCQRIYPGQRLRLSAAAHRSAAAQGAPADAPSTDSTAAAGWPKPRFAVTKQAAASITTAGCCSQASCCWFVCQAGLEGLHLRLQCKVGDTKLIATCRSSAAKAAELVHARQQTYTQHAVAASNLH